MEQPNNPMQTNSSGPSSAEKVRGNKLVRLVIIGVLLVIVAYLLYSVW